MELLTSRENPIIKQYRKLAQSRKEREAAGLFVMEGTRLCCDAAKCGIVIEALLVSEEGERYADKLAPLIAATKRCYSIRDSLACYLSDTEHPQGVFAIGKIPTPSWELPDKGCCILLDTIQDPGNLGTIIRTAESMGIDMLILSPQCPDCYSPKVVRSTMGSCFRQNILRVESLRETIASLQQSGMICYAATLTPEAIPLQKLPQTGFLGIVIGNEGNGVSSEVVEQCTGQVYIPMSGSAESLNAAIAAALCMWQISGQFQEK